MYIVLDDLSEWEYFNRSRGLLLCICFELLVYQYPSLSLFTSKLLLFIIYQYEILCICLQTMPYLNNVVPFTFERQRFLEIRLMRERMRANAE